MIEWAAKAFQSLLEGYLKYEKIRLDADALTALLILELRRNLSVLDMMSSDAKQSDSGLAHLAGRLESTILEQCLMPGRAPNELRQRLNQIELPTEEAHDRAMTLGVLEQIYVRITVVQHAAPLSLEPLPGIRQVHLKTRLENLREALLRALRALQDARS